MPTHLIAAINSKDDAISFIYALHEGGIGWHMDDDPHTVGDMVTVNNHDVYEIVKGLPESARERLFMILPSILPTQPTSGKQVWRNLFDQLPEAHERAARLDVCEACEFSEIQFRLWEYLGDDIHVHSLRALKKLGRWDGEVV